MKLNANIQLITAAILAIGGMVLLFCGLYVGEVGKIEESVLVAFGEVMTFSGSLMGIDYHYRHNNQKPTNYGKNYPKINSNPSAGQSGDGNAGHPIGT